MLPGGWKWGSFQLSCWTSGEADPRELQGGQGACPAPSHPCAPLPAAATDEAGAAQLRPPPAGGARPGRWRRLPARRRAGPGRAGPSDGGRAAGAAAEGAVGAAAGLPARAGRGLAGGAAGPGPAGRAGGLAAGHGAGGAGRLGPAPGQQRRLHRAGRGAGAPGPALPARRKLCNGDGFCSHLHPRASSAGCEDDGSLQ